MKKIIALIIVLILVTSAAIYVKTTRYPDQVNNGTTIPVVASFYPLYFFASEIGGNRVTVANLTPAGAEPHDYEPTTQDIGLITASKLLIINGAGMESWAGKIENKPILSVSDSLANKTITEDGENITDPHIWLDPVLSESIVEKIETALVTLSPKDRSYFEMNKKKLLQELQALDGAYKTGLASCKSHSIVTSHAAFGYLAARYGFTQIAIAGLTPDEEPTPQKLSEVANVVRENHIGYIFFESLVSPRLAETIATETGAQTLAFDPLEGLTPNEVSAGQNYFTIQTQNLKSLRTALSCM